MFKKVKNNFTIIKLILTQAPHKKEITELKQETKFILNICLYIFKIFLIFVPKKFFGFLITELKQKQNGKISRSQTF
jgi:hypothetical protein